MTSVYHNVIRSFPKGYSLAFAYGSGVFRQLGQTSVSSNMMDFVFAVDNPMEWHRENMRLNPRHYSSLRLMGPSIIDNMQTSWGAKVYFNTLVATHAGLIKYGVISRTDLVYDLMDWETMYIAGRLHKPVLMLHTNAEDIELQRALKVNLYAAVHTALLLLPDSFSEEEFYSQITALSYNGDFRMYIGEDNNKIRNIVGGQLEEFRRLYKPVLASMTDYALLDSTTGQGMQNMEMPARHYHLSRLPSGLQRALVREHNSDGRSRDLEDVLRAAAHDPYDAADMLADCLKSIVRRASFTQALKGLLTAGLWKALRYSAAKVGKKILSTR